MKKQKKYGRIGFVFFDKGLLFALKSISLVYLNKPYNNIKTY